MAVEISKGGIQFTANIDDKQFQTVGDRLLKKIKLIHDESGKNITPQVLEREKKLRQSITLEIEKQNEATKKLRNTIISNSQAEVNAYNKSRNGSLAGGTVVGNHAAGGKAANDATSAQRQYTSSTKSATVAQKAQSLSIEETRAKLLSLKEAQLLATDPVRRAEYNRKIQETTAEIKRMSNVGKAGFDTLGNAITKTQNPIQKGIAGLFRMAYLLPGIGVAGLLAFALDPIIAFIGKLDIFNKKARAAEQAQRDIAEAAGSTGEASAKAAIAVEDMVQKFQQAKDGILTKSQVLKDYNEGIGKTLGYTNDLNVAEERTIKNGDAYVQLMFKKADAAAMMGVYTAKMAKAAEELAKTDEDSGSYIMSGTKGRGLKDKDGNDLYEASARRNRERLAKPFEDEANVIKSLILTQNRDIEKFAKDNKLNLNEDSVKPKTKKEFDSYKAAESLEKKIFGLKEEYALKSLDKDEQELQAVRNKFANIAIEVQKFNANPKNKAKVNLAGVNELRDKVITDLTYQQETEILKIEIDKQKAIFSDFESYKEQVGKESADARFAEEKAQFDNYGDYLKSQLIKLEITDRSTQGEKDRYQALKKQSDDYNQSEKTKQAQRYIEAYNNAKTHAQELLEIEKQYQQDIEALGVNATPEQKQVLEKKRDKGVSSVSADQITSSKAWTDLFSNLDSITASQIETLISEIERNFDSLSVKFDPIDLAAIRSKLQEAQDILIKDNPFKQVGVSIKSIFSNGADDAKDSSQKIKTDWNNLGKSTEASFEFVNDAIQSADFLKEAIGEIGSVAIGSLGTIAAVSIATIAAIKTAEKGTVILAIISAALAVIQAIAGVFKSIFAKHDKDIEKSIGKHKETVASLERAYNQLERSIEKALGGSVYKNQRAAIKTLEQQRALMEQMAKEEARKKKADQGKINEYKDGATAITNQIADMNEAIAKSITQTNAKELATELSDAIVDAYSKGEDAAKSFEDVSKNVMANAVKNALKLQFLEKPLQAAIANLQKDMGYWNGDDFVFDGLTEQEQDKFKETVKGIGTGFSEAMKTYDNIFAGETNTNASNSLTGNIRTSLTEDTGTILAGVFKGVQLNTVQLVAQGTEQLRINRLCFDIATQNLNTALKIEANTFRTANNTDQLARLANMERLLWQIENKMSDPRNALLGAGIL